MGTRKIIFEEAEMDELFVVLWGTGQKLGQWGGVFCLFQSQFLFFNKVHCFDYADDCLMLAEIAKGFYDEQS